MYVLATSSYLVLFSHSERKIPLDLFMFRVQRNLVVAATSVICI